jgi:hypothetical protein
MPVLRDFGIRIPPGEVLKRQTKGDPSPDLIAAVDWAIERASELVKPAVAYTVLQSAGVEGKVLHLEGGKALLIGPHAELTQPAERVIISVATIGPHLETEVHELMSGSNWLKGYVLDCAGVVAVGQTASHLRDTVVQQLARAEGWGIGPSIYPGAPMGWTVKGQRELTALVPMNEIGVTLNSSCLLIPQKSSSALVGIGAGYDESSLKVMCQWCSLQETCWRSRAREYA